MANAETIEKIKSIAKDVAVEFALFEEVSENTAAKFEEVLNSRIQNPEVSASVELGEDGDIFIDVVEFDKSQELTLSFETVRY